MDESEIQQKIQIEGPKYGCQLMRNNSGAFKDATGRWVRYGLGNISKNHNDKIKSSDLIGFRNVVVTQEMVGKVLAVFAAIEVKSPDWPLNEIHNNRESAQAAFLKWIKVNGGIAGFANSVESFKRIIGL